MSNNVSSHRLRHWVLLALAAALVLSLSSLGLAHAQSESPSDDASDEPSDEPSDGIDDDGSTDGDSEDHDGTHEGDDGDFSDEPVTNARVFGDDRFATSVAISQYEFPQGAGEVYLARSDNFADAVAAGPLERGPVLLVPQCGEIPAVIADEIARLHPHKVVALGGAAAICDELLDAATAIAEQARLAGDTDDSSDDDHDEDAGTEETQHVTMTVGEERTFTVGDAGTVTIARTDTGVSLVGTTAASDAWTVSTDDAEPGEVEIDFDSADAQLSFRAEVEDDGLVEIRIRTTRF